MFGRERGSLEKSHGIGQTPCSYERCLVENNFYKCFSFVVGLFSDTTCKGRLFNRGRRYLDQLFLFRQFLITDRWMVFHQALDPT